MQMFQKGSPVARDVSRAILHLLEQGELKSLEDKWLNRNGECDNNVISNNTESLKLGSLWVLYVMSGAISTICLLLSAIYSLKSRRTPQNDAQEGHGTANDENRWKRAVKLVKTICSKKHDKAKAHEDVTDCSSRWDYISNTDTPEHQQATASQLPEIIIVSAPPTPIQMTTPDHIVNDN